VLIPLIDRGDDLSVLLTLRADDLKHHAGQISFPGGRLEAFDRDAIAAALRETEEEIGLRPAGVEVLARLPDYRTRTGFRVTPVIGLVTPPLELAPDPREVESVFEVPLAFLLDPRNRQRRTREFQGLTVGYYVFEYQDRVIWGATAGMLVNLYRMLE